MGSSILPLFGPTNISKTSLYIELESKLGPILSSSVLYREFDSGVLGSFATLEVNIDGANIRLFDPNCMIYGLARSQLYAATFRPRVFPVFSHSIRSNLQKQSSVVG